jgi:hypothetical protein
LTGAVATIVLLLYLGAQFAAGIIAGFVGGIVLGIHGGDFDHEFNETMQAIMPWTVLLIMIFGWVAIILVRKTSRIDFKDTSPTGPAWVRGSWPEIAKGVGTGVLLGLLWLVVDLAISKHPSEHENTPMSTLATTPGIPQVIWAFTAIMLAPPLEE